MAPDQTTDEQVLADPSAHTVEEVLGAFENAAPADVAAAQQLEADGKGRKGIVDYAPPAAPDEPRFERDRILDPAEGPRIVGTIDAIGREPLHYEIVGALDGDDSDTFGAAEVQGKVRAYLGRPATTTDEEA